MQVDKAYCMASYLQFRFILDPNKTFQAGVIPTNFQIAGPFYRINTADDVRLPSTITLRRCSGITATQL